MQKKLPTKKLILLGDTNVGKTSILQQYVFNSFNDKITSTTGIDFQRKNIKINGEEVEIQIWDTAGQERYRSLASTYYRRADGVVLCYDLTNKDSFDNLNIWIDSIKENANMNIPVVLIGNKKDMESKIIVPLEHSQNFAADFGLEIFLTSAKTGENIEEAFDYIAKKAFEASNGVNSINAPVLTENNSKKGCC